MPAARNLLNNLAGLGIHELWERRDYCKQIIDETRGTVRSGTLCRFPAFIPITMSGTSLLRTAWVELNCLQIGVGRFHSSMQKVGSRSFTESQILEQINCLYLLYESVSLIFRLQKNTF